MSLRHCVLHLLQILKEKKVLETSAVFHLSEKAVEQMLQFHSNKKAQRINILELLIPECI